MFVGACAGSTGGGLKFSRVIILLKSFVQETKKLFHPRAVSVVRLEGKAVDSATFKGVLTYVSMYSIMICASILLISVDGFDFTTNSTAVISCFNNMGPGLGNIVGPYGNFGSFSPFSKIVLSLDMLFGRLEILPMLVLFTPSAWKIRNS
jgi:trk system potassium uptake protein TrkH